jgi:hypothetical protein
VSERARKRESTLYFYMAGYFDKYKWLLNIRYRVTLSVFLSFFLRVKKNTHKQKCYVYVKNTIEDGALFHILRCKS